MKLSWLGGYENEKKKSVRCTLCLMLLSTIGKKKWKWYYYCYLLESSEMSF